MPLRLFVGNFDFEHRLVHGAGSLPQRLQDLNAHLASIWRLIAAPNDALWWPYDRALPSPQFAELPPLQPIADPRRLAETHELVFWADDEWARETAGRWNFVWHGCDPGIVRQVNSRRFQTRLECDLRVAPCGLQLAANLEELSKAIDALATPATSPKRKRGNHPNTNPKRRLGSPSPAISNQEPGYFLKTEFGNAGRESRRGTGPLTRDAAAWAEKRFARELAIVVEPLLESIAEASLQFQIDPKGHVEFLGAVGNVARPDGTFLANRILSEEESRHWHEVETIVTHAVRRIAEQGYHGPVGIDAMRYRDQNGIERFRPIQDINARYTIGRLALGLNDHPALMNSLNGTVMPMNRP